MIHPNFTRTETFRQPLSGASDVVSVSDYSTFLNKSYSHMRILQVLTHLSKSSYLSYVPNEISSNHIVQELISFIVVVQGYQDNIFSFFDNSRSYTLSNSERLVNC